LRRIELTVFPDNIPAITLYRSLGFIEEGRSRGYAMRDGVLADALHMARLVDAPAFAPESAPTRASAPAPH
jgi:putative acetyltransferase